MVWLFLFFINLVLFLWGIPVEIYYFYPMSFTIMGGCLSAFFTYKTIRFLIAEDLISENKYSFITAAIGVLSLVGFIYMYYARLEIAFANAGINAEATITTMHTHRKINYIEYEYMLSGISYTSQESVPFEYYMGDNTFIGRHIPIIYIEESPWVSDIDLRRMTPDFEARDKIMKWQKERHSP